MIKERTNSGVGWTLAVFIWTFFLAIGLSLASRTLFTRIKSLIFSFLILFCVVLLGIIFDLVGTAATAAKESPLNAKASRKIRGAREAVYLVQNAGKVANFCNDVIGDISGILSGALAAWIVIRVSLIWPRLSPAEIYLNIGLTALVAAFTVGGKAFGKALGINRSTEIILFAGRILYWLQKLPDLFFRGRRDR